MKTKRYAIITGASGGIGQSYARHLAAENFDLVLTGRKVDILESLADSIRRDHHVEVETQPLDLANEEKLSAFLARIKKLKHVEMLVHCAGFGAMNEFLVDPVERQLEMVRVHISATIQLMHTLLPSMIARKRGAVIVVSSLAAFIPAPQSSLYAGTKSFLNSFMESIHMEVHRHGIHVQCLCPGFTRTAFHKKPAFRKAMRRYSFLWMSTDAVVETSLRQLNNGKVICIPGFINRLIKRFMYLMNRGILYSITEKYYQRFITPNA